MHGQGLTKRRAERHARHAACSVARRQAASRRPWRRQPQRAARCGSKLEERTSASTRLSASAMAHARCRPWRVEQATRARPAQRQHRPCAAAAAQHQAAKSARRPRASAAPLRRSSKAWLAAKRTAAERSGSASRRREGPPRCSSGAAALQAELGEVQLQPGPSGQARRRPPLAALSGRWADLLIRPLMRSRRSSRPPQATARRGPWRGPRGVASHRPPPAARQTHPRGPHSHVRSASDAASERAGQDRASASD
jgi:hypothetical protein